MQHAQTKIQVRQAITKLPETFFSSESYLSNAIQRKSIAISLHEIQIIIKPAIEKIIDLFLQNLIIEPV